MQVELLNTRRWATTIELAAAMADYIDNFYNVERRHSYLGNIRPTEFETLWTSTYSILNSHNHGSKRRGQINSFRENKPVPTAHTPIRLVLGSP